MRIDARPIKETDMNTHYSRTEAQRATNPALIVVFWLYVSIPLAWGVWSTLQKATALFNH